MLNIFRCEGRSGEHHHFAALRDGACRTLSMPGAIRITDLAPASPAGRTIDLMNAARTVSRPRIDAADRAGAPEPRRRALE